jgi:CRISPR-associated protein Csx17
MGSWLACVGLLRACSRIDPSARLRWLEDGLPILTSDTDVITAIAASEEFRYTPVLTPWQSGGGWGAKDKAPRDRIALLKTAPSLRLDAYRQAIDVASQVLRSHPGAGKDDIIRLLRNVLPEDALPWLDVAVPLRTPPDGKGALSAGWAPVAGTGGNDGRWDLSTTVHAALLDLETRVKRADPADRRSRLLADLIGGTENEPLMEASAGPYWPAARGLINPWALVLLAEGLCAWGDSGHVHPFGYPEQPWTAKAGPGITGEANRGEAWLPLWESPMGITEVRQILATRPSWRGKPATSATGMYGSMHSLGWPRGITGFLRYGIARRRGLAFEAVLLDGALGAAPSEELTAAMAANRAGVAERTWTSYVARGQAPQPDARDLRSGSPRWWPQTVDAWRASRPGQGARTGRPKTAGTTVAGNGETGDSGVTVSLPSRIPLAGCSTPR